MLFLDVLLYPGNELKVNSFSFCLVSMNGMMSIEDAANKSLSGTSFHGICLVQNLPFVIAAIMPMP